MLRKLWLAVLPALLVAGLVTAAPIPSSVIANCNDASQTLACIQALVNYLNTGTQSGGAVTVVSIGTTGTISGATPQTLNVQRGVVTFTGVTIAGVSSQALVLNNSLITTASQCTASIVSDNSAAASFPYIRSVVPTSTVLTFNLSNAAAATSTGASSFGIAFACS